MRWLTISTSDAAVDAGEAQRITLAQPPPPWQRHLWGILRNPTEPSNWRIITIYEGRRILHRHLADGVSNPPDNIEPIDVRMTPGRRYELEVQNSRGAGGGIDGPPIQIAYEDLVP